MDYHVRGAVLEAYCKLITKLHFTVLLFFKKKSVSLCVCACLVTVLIVFVAALEAK